MFCKVEVIVHKRLLKMYLARQFLRFWCRKMNSALQFL